MAQKQLVALLLLLLLGCVSAPPQKPVTREEIVRRDNALGVEISPKFEAQLKIRQDPEVSVYLRKLAQKLVDASGELKGSSVGVLVIQDRDSQWRNYGLPGSRVYLSSGLIRGFEFENEIAAAIAIELAHLGRRSLLQRLQQNLQARRGTTGAVPEGGSDYARIDGIMPYDATELQESVDYFGPAGVFVFPEEVWLGAVDSAVGMLYRAGFDPRGLANLWKRYQDHPKASPLEPSTVAKLLERTRRDVAEYAPLRNPIVRSADFMTIQKRIKRL